MRRKLARERLVRKTIEGSWEGEEQTRACGRAGSAGTEWSKDKSQGKYERPKVFLVMNRHLYSYLGYRQYTHLIPVTSLTPTPSPSVINSQPLWLPHDKFVLALK